MNCGNRRRFGAALQLLLASTAVAIAGCGGGSAASVPSPGSCNAIAAAPSALAVSSVTAGSVVLSWTATAPTNCTLTYSVYVNGVAVLSGLTATTTKVSGLFALSLYGLTVDASDAAGTSPQSASLAVTTTAGGTLAHGITLTGKLIWHSYTSYGFTGVQSWMANFDTGDVYEITSSRLLGAMNYHFSPDGATVVVMADDNTITTANGSTAWDLWVASVTATGLTNITKITRAAVDGSRNEDPKFSADGSRIIFKRNLNSIASIDVASIAVNGVDQAPPQTVLLSVQTEVSMPYYLVGSDSNFLYADNATHAIREYSGGVVSTLYTLGTHNYYPVAIDATRFYFAAGQSNDWIYRGDTTAATATRAAFITGANNTYEFADPCPITSDWLAYASTVPGGSGTYDIWIGNFANGQAYNLNDWIRGANHANSDLGPTFSGMISP